MVNTLKFNNSILDQENKNKLPITLFFFFFFSIYHPSFPSIPEKEEEFSVSCRKKEKKREMNLFYCCIMYRANTTRKTGFKTSKSSINDFKASKNYNDAEALSTIARSVSMASG